MVDHSFYVKDHGFVTAGELYVGDKLLDASRNVLIVEDTVREITEMPAKVYNFQVEDFRTYHVSELGMLVHNTCTDLGFGNKSGTVEKNHLNDDGY